MRPARASGGNVATLREGKFDQEESTRSWQTVEMTGALRERRLRIDE